MNAHNYLVNRSQFYKETYDEEQATLLASVEFLNNLFNLEQNLARTTPKKDSFLPRTNENNFSPSDWINKNQIFITGIPKDVKAEAKQTVINILETIGIKNSFSNILSARKIKKNQKFRLPEMLEKTYCIVASFTSKSMVTKIIHFKRLYGQLVSQRVFKNTANQGSTLINLNRMLPQSLYSTYMSAFIISKIYNFPKPFVKNYKIFMRFDANMPPKRISSPDCLYQLLIGT